jgi:hypothetical protein
VNWKSRLRFWGYCSCPRLDDKTADAQRQAEMEAHAKEHGMEYVKGLMCHSILASYRKTTWTDEKLSGPSKKRRR